MSRRTAQFLLLIVAQGTANLAQYSINPLQEAMRAALSLSDNQMALLQGPALSLPVVLAVIPLGFVIDRHSRVRLLLACSAVVLAGSILSALAPDLLWLLLGRCFVGLAATTLIITGFSLLADYFPPEQRGRAKAVLVLGQYAGSSVAFAAGGALLAHFPSAQGWRWALLWLTVPALALATVSMLAAREPARTGVSLVRPSVWQSLRELRTLRRIVVPLTLALVLAQVPVVAISTWGAPFLSRHFGATSARAGAIMGLVTLVGGVVGALIGGMLADLCQRSGGPQRTVLGLSLAALLCAPAAAAVALAPELATASVLLIVCKTLIAATVAMGVTLFTIVIPNELRGLCLALLAAAVALVAGSLAPLAVSALSSALGGEAHVGQALAVVCVTASILCATTFAVGRRWLVLRPSVAGAL